MQQRIVVKALLLLLAVLISTTSHAIESKKWTGGLLEKAQDLGLSVITQEKSEELSRFLVSKKEIPYRYIKDGCYARAHIASYLLFEEKGVVSGKVFLEGRLRVDDPYSKNGYATWFYHVATVIIVEENNEQTLAVLDPGISPQPLPLSEWIQIQTRHKNALIRDISLNNRFSYRIFDKNMALHAYRKGDFINARGFLRQQKKKLIQLQQRYQSQQR